MEINYKRRQRIALIISFIILWYMFFVFANDLGDDSDGITATCTVTKAYTKEIGGTVSGMNDIRPEGIFETRENAALITMIVPPEGRKIPEYVETVKPGKKYLFHVSNRSTNKERDFTTTRFEEIKE